jgi:hypothetical protein
MANGEASRIQEGLCSEEKKKQITKKPECDARPRRTRGARA